MPANTHLTGKRGKPDIARYLVVVEDSEESTWVILGLARSVVRPSEDSRQQNIQQA